MIDGVFEKRRLLDLIGSFIVFEDEGGGKLAKKIDEREPRRKVNTKSWYAALKRAGIENFRWHDLRHTWASWHVQQGTPLHALQEMGAWESTEMVRRYAHFSAEHLTPYADRLSGLNVVKKSNGTNTAQAA